jgi:iron complex transport system permease protein
MHEIASPRWAPPLRAEARRQRRRLVVPGLTVALVVTALVCASRGGVAIPIASIGALVLDRVGLGGIDAVAPAHAAVFFGIRLPRIVLGIALGAGLGVSGASMQGVFRNPLVDPGLLGVSSGAALGASAAFVLGAKIAPGVSLAIAPSLAAFAAALVATRVVARLGATEGRASIATLLLAGIAVNALCGALTGLLAYVADDAQLRSVTFWTLGSLGGATWSKVAVTLALVAPPLAVVLRLARPLDALLLGESQSAYLGFAPARTRHLVMACVALMVGASVAVAGVIGFVGLAVPHLLRLAIGSDHRTLLPGSALLGATLLLVADLIARTVVIPSELPLGIVTACVGAPFFLALLVRERRALA